MGSQGDPDRGGWVWIGILSQGDPDRGGWVWEAREILTGEGGCGEPGRS